MGDQFNADEVLGMAMRIEQNGQDFYEKASASVEDQEVSKLLRNLSEWEKGHERIFRSMKNDLTEEEKTKTAIDPYDEEAMYLKTMADQHVFNRLSPETISELVSGRDAGEIIDMAVEFEKDSLLFFLGLARLVSRRLGKENVYKVIDEEIGHITYLERERRRLLPG